MQSIRFPILRKQSSLRDGLSQAVSLNGMTKTSTLAALRNPVY